MRLPGFGGSAPAVPPPPPPPPTPEDPAVADAKKKLRQSELQRRGRASTILTGGLGVPGDTTLNQPTASKLGE